MKLINKKKNIAIDELAGMVQKGFTGMDERFNHLEERFDRLERITIEDHRRRIERLEIEVRGMKDLLAFK